jgi:hypothetical protein
MHDSVALWVRLLATWSTLCFPVPTAHLGLEIHMIIGPDYKDWLNEHLQGAQ